ncbi:hypothetical protein MtrunA17_Chr8g0357641 [Medicago truncatula]|uniref:Uncharacterized protein n=1 Tax=Medicago truncatula TaxID=3880 RepID=A0A072TPL2_MEDTR|nr:hypothetical protein MTR_8g442360 [Medicago truncatula]RHN40697.1 hypothetical protein MtrunA17_Chr8g0357641 [Medicago truncatula]
MKTGLLLRQKLAPILHQNMQKLLTLCLKTQILSNLTKSTSTSTSITNMSGNPNRQRLSKETMTRSARAERQVAHPFIRKGRGGECRIGEGSSSQTRPS